MTTYKLPLVVYIGYSSAYEGILIPLCGPDILLQTDLATEVLILSHYSLTDKLVCIQVFNEIN